jgi:hypothetical protein
MTLCLPVVKPLRIVSVAAVVPAAPPLRKPTPEWLCGSKEFHYSVKQIAADPLGRYTAAARGRAWVTAAGSWPWWAASPRVIMPAVRCRLMAIAGRRSSRGSRSTGRRARGSRYHRLGSCYHRCHPVRHREPRVQSPRPQRIRPERRVSRCRSGNLAGSWSGSPRRWP